MCDTSLASKYYEICYIDSPLTLLFSSDLSSLQENGLLRLKRTSKELLTRTDSRVCVRVIDRAYCVSNSWLVVGSDRNER
jgi:hypothetical protein